MPAIPFSIEDDENVAGKHRGYNFSQLSRVTNCFAKTREKTTKTLRAKVGVRQFLAVMQSLHNVPALSTPQFQVDARGFSVPDDFFCPTFHLLSGHC